MTTQTKIVITALDKTKSAFSSVEKNLATVRTGIDRTAKAMGVITTVAASGLGVLYTKSAQAGDQLAKTADKLGITTEALGGLQYAGELTGVSTQTMNMALQRMTRRLAEAAQGTGEAKGAIKELGLDSQKLAAMRPDEAFKVLSESMKGVESQSDRVRLAMKLFDSEGVALVNTMALGADGLDRMRAEADALGITLSRVDAAKMEAANDAMFRAGQVGTAFGNRIATELAPIVNGLADEFLNSAKEAGGMGEVVTSALDYVVKAVGMAANSVRGLQVVWEGVKLTVSGAVSSVISGMAAADQAVSAFLNKLPGIEAKPSEMLANLDLAFKSTYDDIYKDLNDLLLKPLPSEGVEKWVKDVQSKVQKAAEQTAATTAANLSSFNPATDIPGTTTAENDKTKTKLETLRQSLLTEEQAEVESFLRRQDILNNALQNKLISEEKYTTLSDNLATKHAKKLTTLDTQRAEAQKRVESTVLDQKLNFATQALDIIANSSKEGSAIQKAAFLTSKGIALAQTLMNTEAAAVAAMAPPPIGLGPVAGAGYAATIRGIGYASAGLIAGQAIAGMAHDGMDAIPGDGTWFLQKGERVIPSDENKKITEAVRNGSGAGGVVVNLYEDAEKAGQVSQSQGVNGEQVVNIMVSQIRNGGPVSDQIEQTYQLARAGY